MGSVTSRAVPTFDKDLAAFSQELSGDLGEPVVSSWCHFPLRRM
jgi:hypothetical protein